MEMKALGRYAAAGTMTAIYAAAVVAAYKEQGDEPRPNDAARLKKIGIAAAVMTGLTWLAASL